MSAILSLAIFCAAAGQGDQPPVKSTETAVEKNTDRSCHNGHSDTSHKRSLSPAPARTGRELEQATHAALRRWAQPAKKDLQPAGREYLALYQDLQRDTALPKSTSKELLGTLRFRLAAVAKKLHKQAAAGRRAASKRQPADHDARPNSIDPGEKGAPLGQQGPAGGGAGIGGGGPGFSPARDAGDELADLIESTISPSSWSRNGGLSEIYYWRPGLALVIARRSTFMGTWAGCWAKCTSVASNG